MSKEYHPCQMRARGINLLVGLWLLVAGCASGATFPNSFTTNAVGKTPTLLPTNDHTNLLFISHVNGDGTILQGPTTMYVSNKVLFADNSILVGPNAIQDISGSPLFTWPLYAVSMTDSNEPQFMLSSILVLDSENYNFFGQVSSQVKGDKDSSQASLQMEAAITNGLDHQLKLFLDPGSGSTAISLITNGITVFSADQNGDGLFTGGVTIDKGTHYATNVWSGPTNTVDLSIYDQNYASFTACSVTGFANKTTTTTSEVLLSIKNLSATNFVVTLQAGIVDGDYVSSHTITNGTTGVLWLRYSPQGPRTNSVFRQL